MPAQPKVLYLSYASDDVYALVREAAGAKFDVVTLESDDDSGRCDEDRRLRGGDLRRDAIAQASSRRREGAADRASSGRRLAGHHRLAGDQAARPAARAHTGRHDHRRCGAHDPADAVGGEAALLCRRRIAQRQMACERVARGVPGALRQDHRLYRLRPHRAGGRRATEELRLRRHLHRSRHRASRRPSPQRSACAADRSRRCLQPPMC